MTYCSIEEAWGSDFGVERYTPKTEARTYNRLNEHSGVESRLPTEKFVGEEQHNESVVPSELKSYKLLVEENNELKRLLENLSKSTSTNDDTELYDLILFISSGIIIIFLLDIIVKLK